MYNPISFRVDDQTAAVEFIRQHSFAIVTSTINDEPVATHCPLHFMRTENPAELFGHFARVNPHCAALDGETKILCIFAGPHTYISPTWYKSTPAVPTWNYATVHVSGTAEIINDTALFKQQLLALTQLHDANAPIDSLMPDKYMRGMMRGITGFRLTVSSIQMKLKLSQNKSEEDQLAVIKQLQKSTDADALAIADAMKINLQSNSV